MEEVSKLADNVPTPKASTSRVRWKASKSPASPQNNSMKNLPSMDAVGMKLTLRKLEAAHLGGDDTGRQIQAGEGEIDQAVELVAQ